jgi:roadblock/LC7 domain-containing protein
MKVSLVIAHMEYENLASGSIVAYKSELEAVNMAMSLNTMIAAAKQSGSVESDEVYYKLNADYYTVETIDIK